MRNINKTKNLNNNKIANQHTQNLQAQNTPTQSQTPMQTLTQTQTLAETPDKKFTQKHMEAYLETDSQTNRESQRETKPIQICDTHNDFLTELETSQIFSYLESCQKSGLKKVCASFWSSEMKETDITRTLNERNDLITNWNKKQSQSQTLLHLEDLWWVKNKETLNYVLEIKPFSCSLTWNFENCLAGGAKSNGRLSKWGKYVVEKLIENNIVVDVAHLNRASFWQVADIVQHNIFCSHTGFCGIRNNPRNLTREQIETIAKSDGFVGLFFFDKCIKPKITTAPKTNTKKIDTSETNSTEASITEENISETNSTKTKGCLQTQSDIITQIKANVTPPSTENSDRAFKIEDIFANIKFFTSNWGFENLGIGSDFYGISRYPENLSFYSDFKNLNNALSCAGITQNKIDLIFHINFENYLSKQKNM